MSIRIDPDKPKYALILLDQVRELVADKEMFEEAAKVNEALAVLEHAGVIDTGRKRENEFFVLRLRDQYSDDALFRYALSANYDGEGDYSRQIEEMAMRAGVNHPNCKKPD